MYIYYSLVYIDIIYYYTKISYMKIDCGIIGLPNVGKSTIFNILTNIPVKMENFPFCTIRPNIGVVSVPDIRVQQLANIIKSRQVVYSTIDFIDIAGLIKGASTGEGLGNKILSHIRETKVLCHIVRCFTDNKIIHVSNRINPSQDIDIINTELILFDISQCEKMLIFYKKKIIDNSVQQELFILNKCLINLHNGILLRKVQFSHAEQETIRKFNFLTFKPVIYIANVDAIQEDSIYLNKKLNISLFNKENVIYTCCAISLKCNCKLQINCKSCTADVIEKKNFFLKNIIKSIFDVLNLHTFFTVNKRVARAWIGVHGFTALEAANRVHSDFMKGFIRVQVMKFKDFMSCHGEIGMKKLGKIRIESKSYCIQDGDILKFLFKK